MILNNAQWHALLPILAVSATAIAVMLAIAIKRHHRAVASVAVVGLNLALVAVLLAAHWVPQTVTPLLVVDGYALFYSGLIVATTLGVATLMHAYLEGYAGNREEMYLLLVLAALGGLVLASSNHLASFFIGLELLSIPLFAMIAYPLNQRHALEAGIKYLTLSAAASGFLLFGMALIYADAGTLAFGPLAQKLNAADRLGPYVLVGAGMVLVGAGFKLSLVPFHLWTPDVYDGAPAPVTAFLSTASKAAVFAVLLRFFAQGGGYAAETLKDVLSALAVASILAGNILALMQNNLKRLLAYSSIAHFGYALVALIASGPLAVEAVAVYLLTYVVTNLGAFGVVTLMSSPLGERDADHIYDYRGLFWRRPYLAAILTAMMLSLAGIPITAGFIGKFYVLAVGLDARLWWLVAAVVVGSAIGLFYYLRVLSTLFLQDPTRMQFEAPSDWAQRAGGVMVLGLMLLMMLIGTYPGPFLDVIGLSGLAAP
ncbi:MAG: NADH-quinone oxidoreductase subunit NuoN [Gammaproteobacteria bacterium]|nr:NADH-quinone oxidoreductase subunit NuoN [Gammaproteobacteria bacterium]